MPDNVTPVVPPGLSFVDQYKTYIQSGGALLILIAIIWSGYQQMWVWGSQYEAVVLEKNEWKKTALDGLHVSQSLKYGAPITMSPPTTDQTPADVKAQLEEVKAP